MNGREAAIQLGGPAQFFQRQIGFAAEQFTQLLAAVSHDSWPASAAVILTGNVASLPALLQEFFNHPQRNPEVLGDFLAGAFVLVIGSQNPLPQIQGNGLFHYQTLPNRQINGYNFI
jgi:hypothetical protein